MKKNTRNAQGAGTIRKKTVTRAGKVYTYWEGRISIGRDPGSGKQVQRSFTGKSQKEVLEKMQAAAVEIGQGTYSTPSRLSVGQWLDVWAAEYLNGVKPRTVDSYCATIRNHIKPALGAVKLESLNAHTVQTFYNTLGKPAPDGAGLSPKSIKNVHGVFHKALNQAMRLGYIRANPADPCTLPKVERKEIKPLDDAATAKFLAQIKGSPFEAVFLVTLFTGMRQGEVLGLTWDCVDFEQGTITIKQQLQRTRGSDGEYHLVSPKNGKSRVILPASAVMALLKHHRAHQNEQHLKAGPLWEDSGFVFTSETGHHLSAQTVYLHFKAAAAAIGCPDARFHDLRHSYAVAAIRSGDDIKTVQGNLGHATAAFTLDVYGHVTEQMKRDSAARMDNYIKSVSNL